MEELFMENRMIKLRAKGTNSVTLKVIPGHFATTHSHINYYIDITTLKTRESEAMAVAKNLVQKYVSTTIVDTIVCLDGTQVVGAYLAQELTRTGFMSINSHQTIYVVTPEYNSNSQMIFRDNLQPMIRGKHVLLLMASVTTGLTINKAIEAILYYGCTVAGISAIFSAIDEVNDYHINAVFRKDDVPDYQSFNYHKCPMCKAGQPIEALVNGFGYSKL